MEYSDGDRPSTKKRLTALERRLNAGPTEWVMGKLTIEVHDRVVAFDF